MARTVHQAKLTSPSARAKLKPGRQPHFLTLTSRADLGWKRRDGQKTGHWLLRRRQEGHSVERIALADDDRPADGVGVYDFEMAKNPSAGNFRARLIQPEYCPRMKHSPKPHT